jgi:hypothetical protein
MGFTTGNEEVPFGGNFHDIDHPILQNENQFYGLPKSYDGAKKKKDSSAAKMRTVWKLTNARRASSWCGRVRIEFLMRDATNVRIYAHFRRPS